jgi:Arc/MetJ family transcription regulator
MTKRLIDIDDHALGEARRVLGTGTDAETVDAGLREVIALAARRREIERFTGSGSLDIADAEVIASAWR